MPRPRRSAPPGLPLPPESSSSSSSSLPMMYGGPFALPLRRCFPLLRSQVLARLERLLDPRARVAHLELRRLSGEGLHQLRVLARQLCAHLVGDLRQRALALVVALADQPLAEELLVEHLLILAAPEPLVAALRDPVAAGIGGVDLVDHPERAFGIHAEFVLGVDEDQPALARPRLARREQVQRHPRQRIPLLPGERAARDQLARRDRLVVLADLFLGAGR